MRFKVEVLIWGVSGADYMSMYIKFIFKKRIYHFFLKNRWKCLFGEYRAPTIRQPFLVSASQAQFVRVLPTVALYSKYIGQ